MNYIFVENVAQMFCACLGGWLNPLRRLVLPGPDLTAPECDLAALENENTAMTRATALISKVVHSRALRPLPPTPKTKKQLWKHLIQISTKNSSHR